MVQVDGDESRALLEPHGVKGFPTLKWFVDGADVQKYDGPRTKDGIVEWVNNKIGSAASTRAATPEGAPAAAGGAATDPENPDVILLNESNFEAEVKKHKSMLIQFAASWCG